jgi:periplasmic protein TonB
MTRPKPGEQETTREERIMYADRYAPRRVNRGSLGLSVGIVAPLLAAAMLTSPTVRSVIKDPILTVNNVPLPDPPPPPPKPPQPQPHQQLRPTPPIDQPIPQAPTPTPTTTFTLPDPLPPLDPGTLTGAGAGPATVEPVKPTPVMVGPQLDDRYARELQPSYPPAEQRAGREGRVVVRVLVGVDGRVKQVEQVAAASDAFFEATQKQALGHWRFKPATRDGIPVEGWRTMTVTFHLAEPA